MFGFWKRKPQHSQGPARPRQRSSASFGGMQVRELQARLELLIDAVSSRDRSVIKPARALAEFSLIEQERFLDSVDRISLLDTELAFRFCQLAIPALAELEDTKWESWVDDLRETFKNQGLDASIARIEAFRSYQKGKPPDSGNVAFNEITNVLNIFIHALNGRALKLASSEQSYTDTETLFLPAYINRFKTREENFLLYKALLAHQWAQTWFGTWRADLAESLRGYPDPDRALHLFHWLETLRLDACLKRELPGLAREMAVLRPEAKETDSLWHKVQADLRKPDADVQTTLACLSQVYALHQEPDAALYQGKLCIDLTTTAISERRQRERSVLQNKLASLRKKLAKETPDLTHQSNMDQPEFHTIQTTENEATEHPNIQLEFEGTTVEITPELRVLLDSIVQDYGEIPEHYLDSASKEENAEMPVPKGEVSKVGTSNIHEFLYDEWDHARQRYRNNWCQLYEQSVNPVAGLFVTETLNKNKMLLRQLRRSFEALRLEKRQLKREPFGEDIDIDAAVEAWAETHNGFEASERLFIQTRREERSVAAMFMIDMSASTAGWINEVERESLVLLCEALEQLGDQYAIYGFSGRGNQHCQSFHIKNFNEQYSDEVRHRIEGIQPQDYTRLGAAIRHLGSRLSQVEARTRLLITLTDGRPDDVDGYRGQYGIEDTRKALIEIRNMDIHPFCITIDTAARDYLPHMYGETNYIILNKADRLPQKMADIYRRLTH